MVRRVVIEITIHQRNVLLYGDNGVGFGYDTAQDMFGLGQIIKTLEFASWCSRDGISAPSLPDHQSLLRSFVSWRRLCCNQSSTTMTTMHPASKSIWDVSSYCERQKRATPGGLYPPDYIPQIKTHFPAY